MIAHQLEGLKIRRKAAGVSGVEMAKRLGVNRVTYMQYENGTIPISWNRVLTICNFLGIDNPRRLTEYELSIDEAHALKAHSAQFATPAPDPAAAALAASQAEWDREAAPWRRGGLEERKIAIELGRPRPGSTLDPPNTDASRGLGTVVPQPDPELAELLRKFEDDEGVILSDE